MGTLELYAAVMLLALLAYGVLAGADFGGGVLDLVARGPRAQAQRDAIARAMGPVWEANHVWLIFVIVLLFTGFPRAYELLSVRLFGAFHLVLVGITLRGAAFVFRAYGVGHSLAWGRVFGVASAVTPVLLGMCLGALSSGHLAGSSRAWLGPLAGAMGLFALALCAYTAAVFLCVEVQSDNELANDFRAHALSIGTAVVAASALLLPVIRAEAPWLWAALWSPRALPALVAGAVAALASGWLLRARSYRAARVAAVAQVGCVLLGWALAQWPWVVAPDLTFAAAAAPEPVLRAVLATLIPGMALLLPSLWLLFRVFKGEVRRVG